MANRFLNNITINDSYTLPPTDGTADQVIKTDGLGNLSFTDVTATDADKALSLTLQVKNTESVALTKGQVVCAAPTETPPSGNVIEVKLADNNGTDSMPVIGVLNEGLDAAGGANDEGEAIMFGRISGINTSAFSVGDEVFVSDTPGGLTATKPTGVKYIQKVGVVMRDDASNGTIEVFDAGRTNDVPTPLYIDHANQRLGIGEENPTVDLHINNDSVAPELRLSNPGSGSGYGGGGNIKIIGGYNDYVYGSIGWWNGNNRDGDIAYSAASRQMSFKVNERGISGNGYFKFYEDATKIAEINAAGVYGNVFYDQNNSAYYVNPASTSTALNAPLGSARVKDVYIGNQSSSVSNRIWFDNGGIYHPGLYFDGSQPKFIIYSLSQSIFHDGYHPNADTWTTARTLTIGNTGKSVNGSANVSWSLAEIGAAASSHNHDSDYVNVTGDTMTGALTASGGINGLTLSNGISGSNFNITGVNQLSINDPGEGILFGGGANNVTLYAIDDSTDNKMNFGGASELQVNGSKVFHDAYHPNADKWTTARTITLGGDLTGSVSIDGSSDVTLSAQVNNNSHQHNILYENSTITYGASQLQWMDINGNGGTGLNGSNPQNPTNDWHYHLLMNHANSNGYYVDLAFDFHDDNVWFQRNENGTLQGWRQMFHDAYHPNADTWTTSRTITIGNTGKSVNGSANVSWTLSEIGAAASSHTHSQYLLNNADDTTSGSLTVGSTSSAANKSLKVLAGDSYIASIEAMGGSQGTGKLYVGQASNYGGGIMYNGDDNPNLPQTTDSISFYRRTNNTEVEVFSYPHNSSVVTFNADINISGGDITLGGTGRIQGVDTVSAGTDAANKTYVDNAVSGVSYTHPTHPGDDINLDTGALAGATVISDLDFNITTDTLGHVTDANATYSTRNLTASDVGAASSSHTHTWADISGETANSVNGWGGLRHQTNDGYIDFGPANTSHAHIYTDRPNFYLNKPLTVNGDSIINQTDIRAGRFYDNDNTSYYGDFAGNSRYNTAQGDYLGLGVAAFTSGSYRLNMGGSIDMNAYDINYVSQLHFNDNVRFYDEGNDSYLNFKYGDATTGGIKFRNGGSTVKGYIYADNVGFGLLDSDGHWAVRTQTGTSPLELRCDNNAEFYVYNSYTYSPGSSRAPIFYDSDNTGYYVNPASQSHLNTLTLQGNRIGFINSSFDAEIRVTDDNPNGTGAEFIFYGDTVAGNAQLTAKVGNFTSQVRTPILYDSNNTGYFFNGNASKDNVDLTSGGNYAVNVLGTISGGHRKHGNLETPEMQWSVGGGTDLNWKKLFDVVISDAAYAGWGAEIEITDFSGNFGNATYSNGELYKGALSIYHWGGSGTYTETAYANIPYNLRSHVRWYKIQESGQNRYQLQVKSPGNYQQLYVKVKPGIGNQVADIISYSNDTNGATSGGTAYISTQTANFNHEFAGGIWTNDSRNIGWKNAYGSPYLSSYYGSMTTSGALYVGGAIGNGQDLYCDDLRSNKVFDRAATAYYFEGGNTGDSIRVAGDVVAYYSSDKRLKDNIKPIENALGKVNAISGVTFEWNEKSHKTTGKKDVGVVAQEIEAVLPELVETRTNGYKAVDYQKLTAVLIESVKELTAKVEALESKKCNCK